MLSSTSLLFLEDPKSWKLSFDAQHCPLLSQYFVGGDVPWESLRRLCHALSFGSVQDRQQLSPEHLDADCREALVTLVKQLANVLVDPVLHLKSKWPVKLFGLIHEMCSLMIFNPAFMRFSIFQDHDEKLWRLLVTLLALSFGSGLLVFDSLCGCITGQTNRQSDTLAGLKGDESIWKALIRVQSVWSSLLPPARNTSDESKFDITPSVCESCASALLLTIFQGIIYSNTMTPSKLTDESSSSPAMRHFETPSPPSFGITPVLASSSVQRLSSESPESSAKLKNISPQPPLLAPAFSDEQKWKLTTLSADVLCLSFCETFLKWLRSLHFLRRREFTDLRFMVHFKWFERQLCHFIVNTFADRIEAECVAVFSSMNTGQMSYLFNMLDSWDTAILADLLKVPSLAFVWAVYEPAAKIKHFLLRGVTGQCMPCGWGIASIPPYKISDASVLLISTFQSLEGAARFHLVRASIGPIEQTTFSHHHHQSERTSAASAGQTFVTPNTSTSGVASTAGAENGAISNPAVYCPIAFVPLNILVPILHGRPCQLLLPYIGAPGGAVSAPWYQRSLASALVMATTKGLKHLPFHTHPSDFCDPLEVKLHSNALVIWRCFSV